MKRSAFTMVELIFVIIIIGILAVAAIPKFGDIKDRAKSVTEYSTLSGLSSAITGAMEFQREDFDNILVNWHESDYNTSTTQTYTDVNNGVNGASVLGKILKKNEDFKIVAYAQAGAIDADGVYDDILFIKGKASNETLGASEADKTGSLNGKPDKTDIWVFNASPKYATITYENIEKNVSSGEIMLFDLTAKNTFINTATDADVAGEIAVSCDVNGSYSTTVTIIKLP